MKFIHRFDLNKLKQVHAQQLYKFCLWLYRSFNNQGCVYRAAALTFTSLLTLGPLMIVLFAILMSIPAFQEATLKLQTFILNNFAPSVSDILKGYIDNFQAQSSKIPTKSIFFLLLMAILLLTNIEKALNDIWQIKKRRPLLQSLLLYWALLTLGPIVLGFSLTAASNFFAMDLFRETHVAYSGLQLLWLALPFLSAIVTLTFLYMAIPYCSVKFSHALTGAVFAAICIEGAKFAFAWYVTDHMAVYKMIYGTLAILPIFLIWVYWSWLIFLLGGLIVNGLRFKQAWSNTQPAPPFILALRCLYQLFLTQYQKNCRKPGLSLKELHQHLPKTPLNHLINTLQTLEKNRLIAESSKETYLIASPLSTVTLLDVFRLFNQTDANASQSAEKHSEIGSNQTDISAVDQQLQKLKQASHTVLQVPLQELFEASFKK